MPGMRASSSTRPGLADLGQVMDGARTGLAVAQQSPLGISDQASVITSALTVFARALPEMHRCRPAQPPPGGAPAPRWHPAGPAARWRPGGRPRRPACAAELHPPRCIRAHPSSGRTSPTARVIVRRDTPNQQASTSRVTPWRRCTRGQQSVDEHEPVSDTGPTARWRGRSASRASRYACQRGPARRPAQPALPGTAAARVRLLDTPQPCTVLNEQAVLLNHARVVSWRRERPRSAPRPPPCALRRRPPPQTRRPSRWRR